MITKVDDDLIDGSESLVATIRGHRPGETVDDHLPARREDPHHHGRAGVGREHPGLLTRGLRRCRGLVRRPTCRRVSGDVLPPVLTRLNTLFRVAGGSRSPAFRTGLHQPMPDRGAAA